MCGGLPCPRSLSRGRALLARHLTGAGVELGPGDKPFPVPYPATEVRYVDRWAPEDNRKLFPELEDVDTFPEPDYLCDLNTEGLSPLSDESQDFVIASHVLEHAAEPLGLLVEIHRVLRPGGTLLILLPDRRLTFDKDRDPTSLDHLIEEHAQGVTEVDDAHIVDFLVKTGTPFPSTPGPEREEFFANERLRSIHVHCWHEQEFLQVLVHSVAELGLRWELADAHVAVEDGQVGGGEFGFVLRRSTTEVPDKVLGERLEVSWRTWYEERMSQIGAVDDLRCKVAEQSASVSRLDGDVSVLRRETEMLWGVRADLEAIVEHQNNRLALIRKSPLYKGFQLAKSLRQELAQRPDLAEPPDPAQRPDGATPQAPGTETR